jgi:hypothetical protein
MEEALVASLAELQDATVRFTADKIKIKAIYLINNQAAGKHYEGS